MNPNASRRIPERLEYARDPRPMGLSIVIPAYNEAEGLTEVHARIAAMADNLPLRRMPTPQDFTDAALFLVSQEARCITGQTMVLDCGASAGIAEPRSR